MKGRITQGPEVTADIEESCDVCVIGSGAGGGVLAAGLVEAGLDVVMLEAGGYHTRREFDLHEQTAFPMLYQARGTRATSDLAISILQGRSVGGGTTINWTTCFRTPERILSHWQKVHGIEGLDSESLRPHFEAVEKRLHIHEWPEDLVNANNRRLLEGCRALGYEASTLRRNVKGCANSGFCGLGCPVDGKQSQHVTCIPDAVAGGMRLYSDVEVRTLSREGDRIAQVDGVVMVRGADRDTAHRVTVKPKVVALCGGAINSPMVLLRSGLNQNGRVGHRTFLHPVIALAGVYDEVISPYFGAPQTVGSHHFIDRGPERYGIFLEAAPMHPMLTSSASGEFGPPLGGLMSRLAHVSGLISLHVDGLLPGDEGGTVSLRADGRPDIAYPVDARLAEAMKASHEILSKVHFAAGARQVATLHTSPVVMETEADVSRLAQAEYGAMKHAIFSAHQMGGCSMGPRREDSVVDATLRHHELPNLFVVDGSVLPTALGVNPSETIYGLAHRAREHVAAAV